MMISKGSLLFQELKGIDFHLVFCCVSSCLSTRWTQIFSFVVPFSGIWLAIDFASEAKVDSASLLMLRPVKRKIDLRIAPIDFSMNQPINQSINKSINQGKNPSAKPPVLFGTIFWMYPP